MFRVIACQQGLRMKVSKAEPKCWTNPEVLPPVLGSSPEEPQAGDGPRKNNKPGGGMTCTTSTWEDEQQGTEKTKCHEVMETYGNFDSQGPPFPSLC